MKDFTFHNATKIIFGDWSESAFIDEISQFADDVLVVCSRGKSNVSNIVDKVESALSAAGIKYEELTGIKPNPEINKVREGVQIVRNRNIKFILAIGGGSIIDTAKGIAAGSVVKEDVWQLYLNKKCTSSLPTGVILTLPAAGSESSHASVISNEEEGLKLDILDLSLRPQFAMLDPRLTTNIPPYHTFCGVVDMLSHVMERYFGNDMDNDLTDRLCEGVMLSIINNARLLLAEPTDYSARAQIMWASTIAHNGLLETGREMDWSSHALGMEISAIYDSTHGATLSVITPAWARYVYEDNIPRFAQFAERVFGVRTESLSPEKTALEGIKRLEAFFREMNMPLTLKELGIDSDERLPEMAKKATKNGPIGGIKSLIYDDVLAIYQNALL